MAWYKTGTVTVTNGSATVTGSGTDWISGAAVGEAFLAPDGKAYEIYAVVSATQITLGSVYLGSNASGQGYQILPSQSYIRDLANQAATLLNSYGSVLTGVGAGKFDDGTLAQPGVRFTADENTGMRRVGSDSLALVTGGVDRMTVNNNGVNAALGATTPSSGSFTTVAASGQMTSTVANGTAPLVVASGTKVANLNVDKLDDGDWSTPGAIGSTTPNSGAFTSVAINGADQSVANMQLAFAADYAMDQAAQANKRVTDATTYQTQTGTASFTQSASSELIRTYATATVSLPKAYRNTDYQIVIETVSATPALGFEGQITVQSRAVNSFVLQMSGSATACSVRWKAIHPNAEGRVYAVAPTAQ